MRFSGFGFPVLSGLRLAQPFGFLQDFYVIELQALWGFGFRVQGSKPAYRDWRLRLLRFRVLGLGLAVVRVQGLCSRAYIDNDPFSAVVVP